MIRNEGLLLLPSSDFSQITPEVVDDLIQHFGPDLPEPSCLQEEVERWKLLWATTEEKPTTLEGTLVSERVLACKGCYPNIITIIHYLMILPVTSATVERANSALGFIKNARRNAMREDRLNALLLVFSHADIVDSIDLNKVVDRFARAHPRRVLLEPFT